MHHRVVVELDGHLVGRYHGDMATHVAVIVLASGRIQCRGWGLRVEAEAALERARRREVGLLQAAVHETTPDPGDGRRLTRFLPGVPRPRRPRRPS